jgi:serine/threonine protein phosphatase PrpC
MRFWHVISRKGNSRHVNQDSVVVDDDLRFAAIADGMGGPAGGEIASRIAVDRAHEYFVSLQREFTKATIIEELKKAILDANIAVYEAAAQSQQYCRMGTTLTLVAIIDDTVFCAWVGDTRVYVSSGGKLMRLSKDHTRAQEMLDAGVLSEDEHRYSARTKQLTRWIGAEELVAMDTGSSTISSGSLVIAGTDGAFADSSHAQIEAVLRRSKSPEQAVSGLLDRALCSGAEDDITLVAARIP